jgi:type IV pilus assembly protein PilB
MAEQGALALARDGAQPRTAARGRKRLGERLLEAGLVTERQLAQALQAQQNTGEQLGRLLVRLGYLSEERLLRLLCEDEGIAFTPLDPVPRDPAAIAALPESVARATGAFPLRLEGDRLVVALANPFDVSALTAVQRASGRQVAAAGAPRTRVLEAIDLGYGQASAAPRGHAGTGIVSGSALEQQPEAMEDAGQSASTVAEGIFRQAVELGATDVHVEPAPDAMRVRFRIDGILRPGPAFPRAVHAPFLTRVKVLAGLNIAESRLPQDGRLRFDVDGRQVDLRVSTFPTLHGEDLVLRVLDRARVNLQLAHLGVEAADLRIFQQALSRPSGLVLITGPTGSGKTTTLYSALSELNNGQRCILTLEDPVEYEVQGIRQSQVNVRAGLTFAGGLRSMLRHDPDVILVGEIRDLETAEIALSASMTGHMVLSTLHTNSAAAAIPRLLDMGTEPYALASSLQLCVAQRLIRVLCGKCRQEADVPVSVRRRFELLEVPLFRGGGCEACHGTGYRGRMPVFELLSVSDTVGAAIQERRSAEEIQRIAGSRTLLQAGLVHVRSGATSLEELLRVVSL